MKKIVVFLLAMLPFISFSQKKDIRLILAAGVSKHGTGDMPGYSFLNQADIKLNKRFLISPGLQFTNHSSKRFVTNNFQLNYVTSGVNLFGSINYIALSRPHHQINFGVGPLVRFQNSSVPDYYEFNLSPTGEQLFTLKYNKLHTTSLGYIIPVTYSYQFCNRTAAGAKFILQNDTEADVITSCMAFISIKL